MCRRCNGTGQTQSLPDHLCRSDGQIRIATRHRRFGGKTHLHATVLPRGIRPQERNVRTDRSDDRTERDAHGRHCRFAGAAGSRADRLQRHRRTAAKKAGRTVESRNGVGTDAAGDQDRQTERRGRRRHDKSRRAHRGIIPRSEARTV